MIAKLIDVILETLILLVIIHAIGSWFPQIRESRFYEFLDRIVEPLLRPIRSVVPPISGVDVSPVILIIILSILLKVI